VASWHIGIDGCRAGWFAVALAGYRLWQAGLYPTLAELSAAFSGTALILIDIPMGLSSRGRRRCDLEARKLLGRRHASSIFPPPCHEALAAADYREACTVNQYVLGVKLSRQTYNIMPKIQEADQWRRSPDGNGFLIRESHPELAFWALAGGKALESGKKTAQGKEERLRLLVRHYPHAETIFRAARQNHGKRDLADDDIIDALGLAITGWISRGRLNKVPEHPQSDAFGLPMEMVFALTSPWKSNAPKSP
jgi:predicted RNase H-like nuclease